jgi:nucleoside-diphosphate-sugar epimerase
MTPAGSGDAPERGLTVAVTGPTGDVGRAAVRALERREEVGRIVGMARRPFDPAEHGWTRTEYRRGDILDRSSVEELLAEADVVVHLAFIIFGNHDEAHRVNLEGSRNVFEATAAAGAKRLVYTSSVAAYGFHRDNPDVLTEDVPARGSEGFYYSAHKAELETLLESSLAGSATDAYLFRPCIVAGPDAPTLVTTLTGSGAGALLGPVRRALEALPVVKPVLPDPGVPLQLVHHDDVAEAIAAAAIGRGLPGVYNLAAPDRLTTADIARELGWASVPVPRAAIRTLAAAVERAPLTPAAAEWITAFRTPVLMDSTKAELELGVGPWHSSADTLMETVTSARERGLI